MRRNKFPSGYDKTRIELMHGNIDESSAKCQLSPCMAYYRNQHDGGGRRGFFDFLPFYPLLEVK